MTRLVLLGPPGAGKGTQAQRIAEHFEVPAISTGDLFRAAAADGSELGQTVRTYLSSGLLVPDEVTIEMVTRRLAAPDAAHGFLLDGFPRTTDQALVLDSILAAGGHHLDVALSLQADDEEIIRRLSGRRTCRGCGAAWHVSFAPPREEGVCDKCGGELYQRDDDTAATIRTRLRTYHDNTAPLVDYYDLDDRLVEVDAVGTVDEVAEVVLTQLAEALGRNQAGHGPGWPFTGRCGWVTEPHRLLVRG